jgi:ATP-dependent Clp protease protease subunit
MQSDKGSKRQNNPESDTEGEAKIDAVIPLSFDEMVSDYLARTRRILIVGEINEISSIHVCNYLQIFSLKKDPVYMYINSPGGCMASGYAIIDQMLMCPCPIYTIVRGHAHSMGAIITAFGEKGHRYATPNSSIMLHSPIIQNPPEYIENCEEMMGYIIGDYKDKLKALSKRLNITMKKLKDLMGNTKWMSPSQAMQIGLIDGIWTPQMERKINKDFAK